MARVRYDPSLFDAAPAAPAAAPAARARVKYDPALFDTAPAAEPAPTPLEPRGAGTYAADRALGIGATGLDIVGGIAREASKEYRIPIMGRQIAQAGALLGRLGWDRGKQISDALEATADRDNFADQLAQTAEQYAEDARRTQSPQEQQAQQELAAASREGMGETIAHIARNPERIAALATDSIPYMATGAGTAAGLRAAGATVGAATTGALAVEGGLAAQAAGQQARQAIENMPQTELEALPEYADVAAKYGPGQARQILAERAGNVGAATGAAANLVTLGATRRLSALEQAAAGAQRTTGRVRAGATGVAKEATQEGFQGAGDQFASNVGVGAADSSVSPTDQLGSAAVMEAVAGAPGGLAAAAAPRRDDTTQAARRTTTQAVMAGEAVSGQPASPAVAAGAAAADQAIAAAKADADAATAAAEAAGEAEEMTALRDALARLTPAEAPAEAAQPAPEPFEDVAADLGTTPEQHAALSADTRDIVPQPAEDAGKVEIGPSAIQGQGVIAARPLAAGESVTVLDGQNRTPVGRYANHSSQPTAEFQTSPDGRTLAVVRQPIPAGGEVTVDYRDDPRREAATLGDAIDEARAMGLPAEEIVSAAEAGTLPTLIQEMRRATDPRAAPPNRAGQAQPAAVATEQGPDMVRPQPAAAQPVDRGRGPIWRRSRAAAPVEAGLRAEGLGDAAAATIPAAAAAPAQGTAPVGAGQPGVETGRGRGQSGPGAATAVAGAEPAAQEAAQPGLTDDEAPVPLDIRYGKRRSPAPLSAKPPAAKKSQTAPAPRAATVTISPTRANASKLADLEIDVEVDTAIGGKATKRVKAYPVVQRAVQRLRNLNQILECVQR